MHKALMILDTAFPFILAITFIYFMKWGIEIDTAILCIIMIILMKIDINMVANKWIKQ